MQTRSIIDEKNIRKSFTSKQNQLSMRNARNHKKTRVKNKVNFWGFTYCF